MLRYTFLSSRSHHRNATVLLSHASDALSRAKSSPATQDDYDDENDANSPKSTWRTRVATMKPSEGRHPMNQTTDHLKWKSKNNSDRKKAASNHTETSTRKKPEGLAAFLKKRKEEDRLAMELLNQNNSRNNTTYDAVNPLFRTQRSPAKTPSSNHTHLDLSRTTTGGLFNKKSLSDSSWRRSKLSANHPAPDCLPTKDMGNVTALRNAFLQSNDRLKTQIASLSLDDDDHKSSWRKTSIGGGAREYRKQNQLKQWQEKQQKRKGFQQQQNNTSNNNHNYNNRYTQADSQSFFGTKEDLDQRKKNQIRQQEEENDKIVQLPAMPVTVIALSSVLRVKIDDILSRLRALGENQAQDENFLVDVDTMEVLALDLGMEPQRSNRRVMKSATEEREELLLHRRAEAEQLLPPRPPVVCIMGHVDHGKTTLMDALRRKSNKLASSASGNVGKAKKKKKKGKGEETSNGDVAGTEAGGITQVISAFQVALESAASAVTFLDTPGHAAFRAMRESGSHAADVIVLVVAADDGVSAQTKEIINFYKSIVKSGGISLVVAMTKVDKPGISIDESRYRIENELMELGIVTESFATSTESEFGPPVQLVPVSGLTGEGLEDLIDSLVLQSEVMELRADPHASAEGIVLDARVEKGVGVVADCIVRWGSLERGCVVLSGVHSGRVKALKSVDGGNMKKALPSQPVRIIGFKTLPKAGDPITCVESEEKAEQLIERRIAMGGAAQSYRTEDDGPSSLEVTGVAAQHRQLDRIYEKYDMDRDATATTIRIPILIKADADGTLAALRESLVAIGEESSLDLVVDPIGQGIGPINTNDVQMAKDSNAAIFSFNVKQNDKEALALLDAEKVPFKSHKVIYSLLDDAKDIFSQYLPSTLVEHVHGKAIIQAVFEINNASNREKIAGLRVTDGTLLKAKTSSNLKCHYRVLRNGERISPERVTAASLRRVKEDVEQVRRGDECGLGLDGFALYQEGDIVECYSVEEKKVFL